MGGNNSKQDLNFDPNDWQQVSDPNPHAQEQQFKVVKNIKNGQLLDQYHLLFSNEKQYNSYMQSVDYRRDQDNIVRVVHYEPKVIKEFCGSSYMLNVYLEHCKSRFSQFQDIPCPDNLYCSIAMLDGFQKLYKKVGRFQVQQNQAMIDQNGKIRVWINSDFSQNQAQDMRTTNNTISSKNQQYNMVSDIMNIIFQSSDETDQSQQVKFRDYFEKQKINHDQKVGFIQARNIIYQYAKMNNIQIPEVFTSVLNIYEHNQMEEQQQLTHEEGVVEEVASNGQDQPARVGSYQTNSNTVVSSSFPQINPVPTAPVGVFTREASNSGLNRISDVPPQNNFFQGSAIHLNNQNSGSYIQSFPLSSNSGRGVSPPPPPSSFANSSTFQKVYYPPVIKQQSQISGSPLIIIQPGSPSGAPINRGVFAKPSYTSVPPPQIYSYPHLPNTPHFVIKTQNIPYNRPQQQIVIPINNQNVIPMSRGSIERPAAASTQFEDEVPKKLLPHKRRIKLQDDQLEIQRKYILKKHTNYDEKSEINQYKMSEDEKSKRSGYDVDNSRNASQYKTEKENQINHAFDEDQSSDQDVKQMDDNKKERKGEDGYEFDGKNTFRENGGENSVGKQYGYRVTDNSYSVSQTIQGNQKAMNNFQHFSYPIERYKQPPLPPQYSSSNTSPNSPNQNQKNNTLSVIPSKRQFYYTLQNQIELDPQIANDLSLYAKS